MTNPRYDPSGLDDSGFYPRERVAAYAADPSPLSVIHVDWRMVSA